MRKRLITATSALASLLVLTACSSGSSSSSASSPESAGSAAASAAASATGTYDDHGVTFSYPGTWDPISTGPKKVQAGTASWEAGFGVSPVDLVLVSQYTIQVSIDSSNIDKATPSLTRTISGLFQQGGGTMESGPTPSTMGGFPSLEYTGTISSTDGTPVSSRVVLAFNGNTEYFVNCQYTDAFQAEISDGCDQVVSTFQTT